MPSSSSFTLFGQWEVTVQFLLPQWREYWTITLILRNYLYLINLNIFPLKTIREYIMLVWDPQITSLPADWAISSGAKRTRSNFQHFGQNKNMENKPQLNVVVISYFNMMKYCLLCLKCCCWWSQGYTIRVLSDDTDIFVLLVFWVFNTSLSAVVLMENWEGRLLLFNDTCEKLGSKCIQLLGTHYLTGSDTTPYF